MINNYEYKIEISDMIEGKGLLTTPYYQIVI